MRKPILPVPVVMGGLLFVFLSTWSARSHGDDWPMWRCDAGRTAVSAEALPDPIRLQWKRVLGPVKPAFRSPRLQFDGGYEPVIAGKRLFLALPNTDAVCAFDTDTGQEVWRFYTGGPVRLAPAVWQGRVYFGSDDGHVYCLDAETGALVWRFRAVPSNRKVLGNGRLISLWPVRGGVVVADGRVYFAAGVWPFEGVFVYALDAETGDVVWLNDRVGYLYGTHPHGAQGLGGVTPQGYLVVNGDELVAPCGTGTPAVFDRGTGHLKSFELPAPGRVPGGWFAATDTPEARDVRRGKVMMDSDINQGHHEDTWHTGPGSPGIRSRITVGGKVIEFATEFEGVDGEVYSLAAGDGKLFVVSREGTVYCFGKDTGAARTLQDERAVLESRDDEWTQHAAVAIEQCGTRHGHAVVMGVTHGRLVEELVRQSSMHVIALAVTDEAVDALRLRFDRVGIYGDRVAVEKGRLADFGLPPYTFRLVVAEAIDAAGLADGPAFVEHLYECLRPYGGMACLNLSADQQDLVLSWVDAANLESARCVIDGAWLVLMREGPLPGSVDYVGTWSSPDERVRAPLGILWFDDAIMRHKRAPQPHVVNGVMVSQDKDWVSTEKMKMGSVIRAQEPGTSQYYLKPPEFVDVYTGRLMDEEEAAGQLGDVDLAVPGPEERPPYHYRPPYVHEFLKENEAKGFKRGVYPFLQEAAKGEMVNPMTGLTEPRRFVKSYGCDGGNDYGYLFAMRSATAAVYDKRIESGTINLSGPRSGCTNSIIPANGVLNMPYFYDACSCAYPLPVGAALVSMPQEYEQWTAWGAGPAGPVRRVGVNLGAPGDRVTPAGTLWLDHPSVGGPSPELAVVTVPPEAAYHYRHSVWMRGGEGWPWVCASDAVGLSELRITGLVSGAYTVRLYFAEMDDLKPGERVFDVSLQGETVVEGLDLVQAVGSPTVGVMKEFPGVVSDGALVVGLTADKGATLLSGIEIVLAGLELDPVPTVTPRPRTELLSTNMEASQ
ncbi:MAG: PQQ-binding-like beta-propeller repeat protein [bacterium]|nr:PQQ-binding-like beta-propeller repeat protein [bacterium]